MCSRNCIRNYSCHFCEFAGIEFEVNRFGIGLHVCCSSTTANGNNMFALMDEASER